MIDSKVSVIVTCYNLQEKISKCLDSLLSQTYKNIEIIIVDDGSKDKSRDIINLYQEKDCRIKTLFQKNMGVSAARNNGIDISSGDFLMFIDGDDYVADTYVEHFVEASEGADIVIAGICFVDYLGNKTPIYERQFNCSIREYIDKHYSYSISQRTIFGPVNKLYLSKLIKDNNIKFDESISIREDGIFNIDVISKCEKLVGIEYSEYYYVQNDIGSSLVSRYNFTEHETNKIYFHKMINILGEANFSDIDIVHIFPMYLDMELGSIRKLYGSKEYSLSKGINYIKEILNDETYKWARKKLYDVSPKLAKKYYRPLWIIHSINYIKNVIKA